MPQSLRLFWLLLSSTCWLQMTVYKGFAQDNPYAYREQKKLQCTRGAVVSAHPLASMVGLEILQQGGNAFDAAVAVQLALAVVYPGAGNLGGGGFLVAQTASGKQLALDYRETAPFTAGRDAYLDKAGQVIPGLSTDGHRAAGVPGTPAGIALTLPYTKLPWLQLIQPAINLAEKGFAITAKQANDLNSLREDFIRLNTRPTAFTSHTTWKAGDTLIQSELAATLKRMAKAGPREFYTGQTADLIVAEMKRGQGWIAKQDLHRYRGKSRQPLIGRYRGYDILTMPLPSSGGIILLQVLGMLEVHPLRQWGFFSAPALHQYIEACRRAFADRANYLGDPDFVSVPVAKLLSPSYLKARAASIHPYQASNSETVAAGSFAESEETTHISILDSAGNAVAVTTTLNDSYGSRTVVGGAGFLLNNEMDDFSVKPGVPNMYGAVGSAANAVAPGKRMLSSMTPTIVLQEQKPIIITGTPGGTTIPTSVVQTLLALIDFEQLAETAVNAPKLHHQWLPDQVYVEPDFPTILVDSLRLRGHKVVNRSPIGRVELIRVRYDGTTRQVEAIADKRGNDDARGY